MDSSTNELERLKLENALLKEELLSARDSLEKRTGGSLDIATRAHLRAFSDSDAIAVNAELLLTCKDEMILYMDRKSLEITEPFYSLDDVAGRFIIRLSTAENRDIMLCRGVYVDEEFATRGGAMPSDYAFDISGDAGLAFRALEANDDYIPYVEDGSATENSGSIYIDRIHIDQDHPHRTLTLYMLKHLPALFELKYNAYLRYACIDIGMADRELFRDAGFREVASRGPNITCMRYYDEEDHVKAVEE